MKSVGLIVALGLLLALLFGSACSLADLNIGGASPTQPLASADDMTANVCVLHVSFSNRYVCEGRSQQWIEDTRGLFGGVQYFFSVFYLSECYDMW